MSDKHLPQPKHDRLTWIDNMQTKLSEKQMESAIQLMHLAFLILRSGAMTRDLLEEGKGKRQRMRKAHESIVTFGEALHNIPLDLVWGSMDFDFHRKKIGGYIGKCPELKYFLSDLDLIQDEVDHIRS